MTLMTDSRRQAMIRHSILAVSLLAVAMVNAPSPAQAQDIPAEYQQVLSALAKQGDFKDNVLKVNIPRNDVKVTVAGVPTPTPFGFGGWVAMTKGDGGHQVLMGDLVLLQDEVNPVMSALLDNGTGGHRAPQSLLQGRAADVLHARSTGTGPPRSSRRSSSRRWR
jgi:hypothetical protein